MYVTVEKKVLSLNNKNVNRKQHAKHIIIVLRKPSALAIHPEEKLPANPPEAIIIMVTPRIFCASATEEIFCDHVGAQEKIAHRPISIAPNIIEPDKRFFLFDASKSWLLKFSFVLFVICFHVYVTSEREKKINKMLSSKTGKTLEISFMTRFFGCLNITKNICQILFNTFSFHS